MPVRTLTTRTPWASAAAASRSQITQTSARKSSPGGRALGQLLVAVRAVVADGRSPDTSTRGRSSTAARPATTLRVPSSRDDRIRALAASDHRCATGSPARWTTASRPVSASAGAGDASGSAQRTALAPASAAVRALGVAAEDGHLVPALDQRRHQPRADQPRRSRHRHPHSSRLSSSPEC